MIGEYRDGDLFVIALQFTYSIDDICHWKGQTHSWKVYDLEMLSVH